MDFSLACNVRCLSSGLGLSFGFALVLNTSIASPEFQELPSTLLRLCLIFNMQPFQQPPSFLFLTLCHMFSVSLSSLGSDLNGKSYGLLEALFGIVVYWLHCLDVYIRYY